MTTAFPITVGRIHKFAAHRRLVHNCDVTSQLYYQNPDIHEFGARVDRVVEEDGRTVVILDQTAFTSARSTRPSK